LHRHGHPSIMIKQAGCSPIISLIRVIPLNEAVRRPRWPSSRMVSANEQATSYASLQDGSRPRRRGKASFVRGDRSLVILLCSLQEWAARDAVRTAMRECMCHVVHVQLPESTGSSGPGELRPSTCRCPTCTLVPPNLYMRELVADGLRLPPSKGPRRK
jgi:hypothetical protein